MTTGFKLGPLTVQYFGIIISAGVLAAGLLTYLQIRKQGRNVDVLFDALPWLLLGGILGARIWHIIAPPKSTLELGITTRYYVTHLNEALAFWKGGVSSLGALMGGLVALGVYCQIHRQPILSWLDTLSPGLALGLAIGQWASFVNQEMYGLPTNLPWALYIDPSHRLTGYEQAAYYHPLFLYQSLVYFILMGLLLWVERKSPKQLQTGWQFWIFLFVYGAGKTGIEFLRLDTSTVGRFNLNQFTSAAAALFAGLMLLRQKLRLIYNRLKNDQYKQPNKIF